MLHHRSTWLMGGYLLVCVVVYLSLVPHPPEPLSFPNSDKLEHGLAYATLSLWFCQIYSAVQSRVKVIAMLILMGFALELLQGWGGYRYFEYADMLANSMGVLLGFLLLRTSLGRTFILIEKMWR